MIPSQETLQGTLSRELPGHGKIAVAVSGGVDSVVLAEILYRMKAPIVIFHFNHCWRGGESDEDERWIIRWAGRRKIPVIVGRAETIGKTSEAQAREQRWGFFAKACREEKISEIWLAHHADDLVETFLLQLMRGAGVDGLASLQARRKVCGVMAVRPLLPYLKEELLKVAKSLRLKWREDGSNQSRDYLRNRLRLEILPLLSSAAGRDVRRLLHRTATLLTAENDYWRDILPEQWPVLAPVKMLKSLHLAHQRRWIRGWLQNRGVTDLSYEDVEQVRGLLIHLKPSKVNLSRGWHCGRRTGSLWISEV